MKKNWTGLMFIMIIALGIAIAGCNGGRGSQDEAAPETTLQPSPVPPPAAPMQPPSPATQAPEESEPIQEPATDEPAQGTQSSSAEGWMAVENYRAQDILRGTPVLAVNGRGDAVMAWSLQTTRKIVARRYLSSEDRWSPPEQIGNALTVSASINDAGNIAAVFSDASWGIQSRFYLPSDSSWSNEIIVRAAGDIRGEVRYAEIAMDNAGNAFVVWTEASGGLRNIYARRWSASARTWDGAPTALVTGATGAPFPQGMAVNPAGNAFVVWSEASSVYVRRYSAAVNSWGDINVKLAASAEVGAADVAIDDNGNAIAVWRQAFDPRDSIIASRFDAARAKWSAPFQLTLNSSLSNGMPRIAMTPGGDATVAWIQWDTADSQGIRARRFVNGNWADIQTVAPNSGSISNLEIAVDIAGGAFAVWNFVQNISACSIGGETCQSQIKASHLNMPDGVWGAIQDISPQIGISYADITRLYPRVAMDDGGRAIVIWNEPETRTISIRRFE